ncbi:hypothetical protein, partial [Pseudomonas edaphica]|uniref:hypothetical protein n=1 Tax=Pseudomonas edaphica TaxID=2006980 RepID=UPI001F3E0009
PVGTQRLSLGLLRSPTQDKPARHRRNWLPSKVVSIFMPRWGLSVTHRLAELSLSRASPLPHEAIAYGSGQEQIVYHFYIYLEQSNSFLRTSDSPL